MRVSIVGAGYVGVVTGACLADVGHDVVLADLDENKVATLEAGSSPIYEPGLDELVSRHAGERLHATTDLTSAVAGSELTLVAVGTPDGDTGIDLGHVAAAARAVGSVLAAKDNYHVVAIKSTVVPGTTDGVVIPLLEDASGRRSGVDFGVGVNPEFLTEGRAIADFQQPDRIVLGASDQRVHAVLSALYAGFPPAVPRILTNTRTAEMIKYASNALLATMISFSNEIADLCSAVGEVDVVDVMRGVHLSQYLSLPGSDGLRVHAPITAYLEAGCGFGGSCLPKDVRAIVAEAERLEQTVPILRGVLETNARRPDVTSSMVERELGGLPGKRVAVLGLAFKPDTDDVRDSPAIPIVQRLDAAGATVTVHDPIVRTLPPALDGLDVEVVEDLEDAIRDSDAIVIVTRWREYERLPELLAERQRQPVVVDGRRMLDAGAFERYAGIGR